MASIMKNYRGRYLKAEDIARPVRAEISEIVDEQVNREDPRDIKSVVYFKGGQRGLVLNQTNARALAEAFGDNIEGMRGKVIELYRDVANFGGKSVPCVRLRLPAAAAAAAPAAEEPPPQQEENPFVEPEGEDDIPF